MWISAGGPAAEGLGTVGVREHVMGVAVALRHRQRRVEGHPENEVGELAEAAAHIAADAPQEEHHAGEVAAPRAGLPDEPPVAEGLAGAEEDAALAYTGPALPFTDIQPGSNSAKYVGYAYAKGYTNGYTATLWRPNQTVSLNQYTEFLLRALGYSSVTNTDLSDTLDRAVSAGLINSKESAALAKVTFLRSELVYLSFRSLDATVSGTMDTLSDTLIAKGVFTSAEAREGRALVSARRLG